MFDLTSIVAPLIALGLPGVIILVLLYVIYVLFGKYEEAQGKRIEEGLANQEKLHEAIMALRERDRRTQ